LCAGVFAGLYLNRQQSGKIGELNSRYAEQQRNADTTISGLESNLERERAINTRAREIVGGASNTVQRNVRNLQDALAILKELRSQIKVLEEFYGNRDTGGSGD
jgi:hypothetical protein